LPISSNLSLIEQNKNKKKKKKAYMSKIVIWALDDAYGYKAHKK
jgi:hypothetical protein